MDLARAEATLRERKLREAMAAGATVIAPETVVIERSAAIGEDVTLGPGSVIRGRSRIGEGALLRGSTVDDFTIGAGSRIIMSLLCAKEER